MITDWQFIAILLLLTMVILALGISLAFNEQKANASRAKLENEKRNLEANLLTWKLSYADLVDKINRKGGQQFLDYGQISRYNQFSKDELKALRVLAHPDKHGGNKVANKITKKLNAMISQS